MSDPNRNERLQQLPVEHVMYYRGEREIGTSLPFKIYEWQQPMGSTVNHAHDYIQIWYVVKGEFIHTIKGQTYHMVKGNIFVVPPNAVHRVDLVPGKSFQIIGMELMPKFINEQFAAASEGEAGRGFDDAYLAPFTGDDAILKVALTGEANMEVLRLLESMLREFQSAKRFYELLLRADLLRLLAITIREAAKQAGQLKDEDEKVEQFRELMTGAIQYVHDHYAEDLRLEMICKKFTISKSYFCQLFKRFTGKTYGDYIIDYRLQKAAEMLLNSDMTVTDISYGAGFNDLAYFSRVFKRHTGVTPSDYKKKAYSIQI